MSMNGAMLVRLNRIQSHLERLSVHLEHMDELIVKVQKELEVELNSTSVLR